MRGFFTFIASVIAIVIIAALAIFAVQNMLTLRVSFLGRSLTADLWWLVVGAAVLGFILALLLLAPGRVAAGWRSMVLQREAARRERELGQLREQHMRLRTEHGRLQADHAQLETEHDQLQAQRTPAAWPPAHAAPTTPAAAAAPTAPPTTTAPAPKAAASGATTPQPTAPAAPTPAQSTQPTQTAVPAGQGGHPEQEQARTQRPTAPTT
jgi:uncharacterized integral membrane protein